MDASDRTHLLCEIFQIASSEEVFGDRRFGISADSITSSLASSSASRRIEKYASRVNRNLF
jgi:hypothetical protein